MRVVGEEADRPQAADHHREADPDQEVEEVEAEVVEVVEAAEVEAGVAEVEVDRDQEVEAGMQGGRMICAAEEEVVETRVAEQSFYHLRVGAFLPAPAPSAPVNTEAQEEDCPSRLPGQQAHLRHLPPTENHRHRRERVLAWGKGRSCRRSS